MGVRYPRRYCKVCTARAGSLVSAECEQRFVDGGSYSLVIARCLKCGSEERFGLSAVARPQGSKKQAAPAPAAAPYPD